MAQGTLTLFEEFAKTIGDGTHDLDNDTFKLALVTESANAIVATATPSLDDFTEITGGTSYTAGGATLTTRWSEVGGTAEFAHDGGTITWNQDASGNTSIKTGIIYNTALGNNAICFIDFTSDDGTTAISLVDGDITWTPDASNNIFTLA